ncbi:Cuticle protein 16.8-like 3 [Homarus americanus]|uniref:Cuticle protein 16.8-like 3 n=1 Tax=Homarus americanus TaxID=6706 RepID=A0A8J5KDL7_HOMAM|nr:Cuticle protein 16.8-like 3 [Homarus americanus]
MIAVLVLLALSALVAARPDSVFDFDMDDMHHDQSIDDDNTFTGSYSFMTPEGIQYFIKYVADDDGFRIVESNAVPISNAGVRADGNQGSFTSSEELPDRI